MKRNYCLWLTFLALCSCAINKPVPDDHYYKLPSIHAVLPENRLTSGAIFVAEFIADGVYRERALLHTVDKQGIELVQFHYHFWIDSPSRLLRDQLIRYLKASRAATHVSAVPDASAELGIHGTVKAFEIREGGHSNRVFVDLGFRVDKKGMESPLLLSDYQAQVQVTGQDMIDTVDAYETALSQIFARLLTDLKDRLDH